MPSRFNRRNRRHRRRRKVPIVKLIKKVIKSSAEHKYLSVEADSQVITNVDPFTVTLNPVSEGTNFGNRIGIIIDSAGLKIRYRLQLLNSNLEMVVRVFIIQSMAEVDPVDMPGADDLMPTLKLSKNAYRILYDRTHELSLGIHQDMRVNVNIPGRKMIDARFEDSGAINFTRGKIILHFVTDNTITSDLHVGLFSRYYFTDT